VISEGCVLDARNEDQVKVITLGDDSILSNNVVLSCKGGVISIGKSVGLNSGTVVQSTNNCPVKIGDDGIIGQNCFIIGGGSYNTDRVDIPIRLQGIKADGGVTIGSDVWLGANVTVLGGVIIGEGSVVAASAVMTKSVDAYSICKGIPAKVTGNRKENI
jgi:galactoside O-acetyltransferase